MYENKETRGVNSLFSPSHFFRDLHSYMPVRSASCLAITASLQLQDFMAYKQLFVCLPELL